MSSRYEFDVVVIGGGAAGLTASGIAANFGAKTMMVEADKLGGDCTWTGCVPSKALLKAAKVAHQTRNASKYGLVDKEPRVNFPKLMAHVRETRSDIYEDADRPEIFENMGIEVVQGHATFTGEHSIRINLSSDSARTITSRFFFICTGASPEIPPIDGIQEVDYLTNETLFELEELPKSLTIIGAGPIGTEMAQALSRLGADVSVVDMADRILSNDDEELAGELSAILKQEGVKYYLRAEVEQLSKQQGNALVQVHHQGESKQIASERILIATGREANVGNLGLEKAGVGYTKQGIEVDDRCRTNKRHIYACGDVTGRYQFTHMSDHMAKVATTNALLKFPMKIDAKHVPWVTYTDPELAHLGATPADLEKEGTSFQTYRFPYSKIDRAAIEAESEGLIKLYAKRWSGKILGADILGENAGELISEYAVAMRNGVSLRDLADTIHPYPSYGLGARRAADQWYIKNQKEWMIKIVQKLFGYRGELPDFSDPDRIV